MSLADFGFADSLLLALVFGGIFFPLQGKWKSKLAHLLDDLLLQLDLFAGEDVPVQGETALVGNDFVDAGFVQELHKSETPRLFGLVVVDDEAFVDGSEPREELLQILLGGFVVDVPDEDLAVFSLVIAPLDVSFC